MARTIKEIQDSIIKHLEDNNIILSSSKTSEGRLWTFIVATAHQMAEIVFGLFKSEVSAIADKITAGTPRWYAAQCKKWQNGHELLFNQETTELYYAEDDPAARLVSIVALTESEKRLSIKVAKTNQDNKIEPLTPEEHHNFIGYIESIKFAGIETSCISTFADEIKYTAEIYFTPSVPLSTVTENVEKAIDNFRQTLEFDSMFYRQRFIDAIMRVHGVVTVDLQKLEHKNLKLNQFQPILVVSELEAGYFDFTQDSILTFKSTK